MTLRTSPSGPKQLSQRTTVSLTLNTLLFLRQNALYAVLSRFAIYETEVSETVFAARGFSLSSRRPPVPYHMHPGLLGQLFGQLTFWLSFAACWLLCMYKRA